MVDRIDLEGSLRFLGVPDLIQLLGSNANTGVLSLKTPSIPEEGQIFIYNGNPVDAKLGKDSGAKVIFSFFGWSDGSFRFIQKPVDPENKLKQGRMQIILDGLRMLDDGEIKKLEISDVHSPKPPVSIDRSDLHVIKGPFVDYMYVIDEELYDDGQEFVVQGSYGSWIWVVLDGVVEIVRKIGNEEIPILKLGSGTFIGNLSAFIHEKRPRSASVIAKGKVQLGIVDNQRLSTDFARLSHDFRNIVVSLDRRLKMVTDTYISLQTDTYSPPHKEGIFSPFIKIGDTSSGLWRIDSGEALVVKKDGKKGRLVCDLGVGDFIGSLPFLDIEMEPSTSGVYVSSDIEMSELDIEMLHSEYKTLSDTLKNMLSTLAKSIAVTGNLITNNSVKRREG